VTIGMMRRVYVTQEKTQWACLRKGSTGKRGDRQPNNKERCDTLSE